MGVDLQTYRAKIGTFRHSCGADVVMLVLVVNFSRGLKAVGSVLFIGILLIMAGIEPNPGPKGSENKNQSDFMKTTKIKVTGLPVSISKEVMEMYFEHKSGSEVKEVTFYDENRCAIIDFIDANAVEEIMRQLPICLSGTTVSVDIYDKPPAQDDAEVNPVAGQSFDNKQPTKIKVTGLPKEATEEILVMFFENENRQGGGKVKDVTVNTNQTSAVIEFEEAAAVDRVMQKQPIVMLNTTVNVEVDAGEKENTKPTTLKVSGLPDGATDEILIMFFENEKRQGGGRVKSVTMSSEKHSAIVEFEESSAIDIIMEKQPIRILGTEVQIQAISKEKSVSTRTCNTIEVAGLPKTVTEEILLMFFENENRQGGGKVKTVRMNKTDGTALIEFEEEKAVDIVLHKRPVKILGCEVNVQMFDGETSTEITKPTKLKVSGLPENASDEILIMFLENEKRQGGGKVKGVTMSDDKHSAIVEFEESSAIDIIIKKQPIRILETEVQIEVMSKEKTTTKIAETCSTIKVSGLPKAATEEIILMFFENENRQGGGKVKDVRINKVDGSALVEFEEEKAVEIVLHKRPITLLGFEVNVQKFAKQTETECIQPTGIVVKGIPETVTEEYLSSFFEDVKRQGGGKLKSIDFNKYRNSAVMEFEDHSALTRVLENIPITIRGTEVEVCVFEGSNVVEVRGFQTNRTTETSLWQYFEDGQKSGGGDVVSVDIKRSTNVAIVTFAKPEGEYNNMCIYSQNIVFSTALALGY